MWVQYEDHCHFSGLDSDLPARRRVAVRGLPCSLLNAAQCQNASCTTRLISSDLSEHQARQASPPTRRNKLGRLADSLPDLGASVEQLQLLVGSVGQALVRLAEGEGNLGFGAGRDERVEDEEVVQLWREEGRDQ